VTVQLWIGQEFDTSLQRQALHAFWNDIQAQFGQSDDLYLVLASYFECCWASASHRRRSARAG
jgi:hypothetical protein